MRKLLFKAGSEADRARHADILGQAASIEYRAITGKENKMPRHPDCPVVCCQVESDGYWYLVSNDPDLDTTEIANRLKAWDGSRAMQ